MAAQAWRVYNKASFKIGSGAIDLPGAIRVALVTSASNFATLTMSLLGSLTNQVTEANGYSSSGKALASEAWAVGASAGVYALDAADPVWTATGGTIPNIKAAVLFMSGASAGACQLLAFASLTSTQFTLASGNTLTLQFNSSGIFTVARA
jgi:hypothetical protein